VCVPVCVCVCVWGIMVMRDGMIKVEVSGPLLDVVGTGGDGANTVNLSTGAALVAAACGARVAKHGNRSVSSNCGSADVMEALGLPMNREPIAVANAIEQHGFGYLYAPYFHPLMARLREIRQSLGIRTSLNLAGPLLNPARPDYAVIGTYAPHVVELLTGALLHLGVKRAFVFHGTGTDEICALGPAVGTLIENGVAKPFSIDPKEYGIAPCSLEDLQGGDAKVNASILQRALSGERGAVFDSLALSAGVALYIADQVQGIQEGVDLAMENMLSGKSEAYLKSLRDGGIGDA